MVLTAYRPTLPARHLCCWGNALGPQLPATMRAQGAAHSCLPHLMRLLQLGMKKVDWGKDTAAGREAGGV
jgi:hypothetical protein